MKNSLLVVLVCFCSGIYAQSSSSTSVNSTAVIVEPIEITKNVDLHFGNVISGYNPGTLILSPEGSRTAFGVQLSPANPGEVSAAEAVVKHGNYNYSITLPENFTLFNEANPNQFLVIDRFTVEPEITGNDTDILKIGATLNLEANQPPGFYTNSSGFNVTVTYN
ncbi:DUF4402 domain-containing protein [Gramella jeungdoensis]|uniref:DUF4402 domain-containing protein n=1 Tax=Gramella jeungdoensis TaxID=708091 RepID=A0ABT0Z5V1_9FLAO|nr:DUF4402 domain-containing protein [Gramella jeungdoensis]MCM8570149.1 DUF4402 domain-containing protein [Gramella jeungdoensis]